MRLLIGIGVAAIGAGAALFGYGLETKMTPTQWATFLVSHSASHGLPTRSVIQLFTAMLENLDRMNLNMEEAQPSWIGASARRDVPRPTGRLRTVGSIVMLRQAVSDAQPADVIELLPGHYPLDSMIQVMQPGSDTKPITIRAASLGSAVIDATTTEAFKVYAPHWVFENLVVRGVCPDDAGCDHAFHVVGGAVGARFRNLWLENFNAHFKINVEDGEYPDNGRIEAVTLIDTTPRHTPGPVTPIDLDAASNWIITGNFIADFIKAGGDQVSYGGYAKAAGSGNKFERNVIICEWHLRAQPGQRIGLSFGGGGSDPGIRRDQARSGYEQSTSSMQDNLIVSCSDDGIYINHSPGSLLRHNTLIDTGGIDVRFDASMATVKANLVDGPIRARDGGELLQDDNLDTGIWKLFLGMHPVRAMFADPARLDLRWSVRLKLYRQATPPDVEGGDEPDLCRTPRAAHGPTPLGAFADFSACLAGEEFSHPGKSITPVIQSPR